MKRLLLLQWRSTRTRFLLVLIAANLAFAALIHAFAPALAWPAPLAIPHAIEAMPRWLLALKGLHALVLLVLIVGRLHDLDRRGWWALLFLALAAGGGWLGGVAGALCGTAVVVGWLALLLWPGTIGPNRFGPDPRGWESREHFDEQERRLAEEMQQLRAAWS